MTGRLLGKSQRMNSSQPELNGLKYRTEEASSTQEETEREAKQTKKANTGSTKRPLPALLDEESEDKQQRAGPGNMPKPPPIYRTDDKNISLLVQLLEQIAKQQYEDKTLAHTQVKIQP
jgi:hypothetical protein